MSGTKQEYLKIVSYIKRDIEDVETELAEYMEALGYIGKLPLHIKVRLQARVNNYNTEVSKLRNKLSKFKRELKDFIKDTSLKADEVAKVRPATDEELETDYARDMAELNKPTAWERKYNEGQHLEILAYCQSLQARAV